MEPSKIAKIWREDEKKVAEIEFVAMQSMVDVIFPVKLNLQLHNKTYETSEPNERLSMPLWLAIELQAHQAKIIPPPWMEALALQELIEQERAGGTTGSLAPVPEFYIEVAYAILNRGEEVIQNPAETRVLLEELIEVRKKKLLSEALPYDNDFFEVRNLTRLEKEILVGQTTNILEDYQKFMLDNQYRKPS